MDAYIPYSTEDQNLSIEKIGKFTSRETCLSRDETWISWLIDRGLKYFISIPCKGYYEYYIHEPTFLSSLKKLGNEIQENWKEHLETYQKAKKELIRSAEQLSKSPSLEFYKDYIQNAYFFGTYIWGPWTVIYHIEKRILQKYPNKILLISSLDEPIELVKMHKEMLSSPPGEIVEKYGWIKMYGANDKPYSLEEIKNIKINKRKIEEQFIAYERNKKEYRNFLKSVDKEDRTEVEMVHTYAWMKTDRVDTWKKTMYHLIGFYQYLADIDEQWNIDHTVNFTTQEIIDLLSTEKKPFYRENALFYFSKRKISVISKVKQIQELKNEINKKIKSEELKGIEANGGKARGIVKIITNSKDLSKVEAGDIFIAKYTFPHFASVMVKAAAIVTDEGGITSHAAIISREYDIPCLVGTKNATEILKDGDLVEVDTSLGVIKKIS